MVLIDLWAALTALAMILYVVLDGISLGIGLLFSLATGEEDRSAMMGTIAPVWDANQTWIVFGGAAIFTAFPLVYCVLSSALYVPLITFITGLIFRGVTFEFRAASTTKKRWDRAFFGGSLVAVVSQGFILGGLLSGIPVVNGSFAGSPMGWLNPFSTMVALALIPGYAMLASCWLIMKTGGPVQDLGYRWAFRSTLAVLFFMAVVTVWTPSHYPLVWKNWFSPPRIYFVWAFPLLGLIAAYRLFGALRMRRESAPLCFAAGLFLAGYFGLITSLYPYAIPPSITLTDAAAEAVTLRFALWGAVIVLPLVLAYIIYSYAVFSGKSDGEHHYG